MVFALLYVMFHMAWNVSPPEWGRGYFPSMLPSFPPVFPRSTGNECVFLCLLAALEDWRFARYFPGGGGGAIRIRPVYNRNPFTDTLWPPWNVLAPPRALPGVRTPRQRVPRGRGSPALDSPSPARHLPRERFPQVFRSKMRLGKFGFRRGQGQKGNHVPQIPSA